LRIEFADGKFSAHTPQSDKYWGSLAWPVGHTNFELPSHCMRVKEALAAMQPHFGKPQRTRDSWNEIVYVWR
jgi:hypothetical protein